MTPPSDPTRVSSIDYLNHLGAYLEEYLGNALRRVSTNDEALVDNVRSLHQAFYQPRFYTLRTVNDLQDIYNILYHKDNIDCFDVVMDVCYLLRNLDVPGFNENTLARSYLMSARRASTPAKEDYSVNSLMYHDMGDENTAEHLLDNNPWLVVLIVCRHCQVDLRPLISQSAGAD